MIILSSCLLPSHIVLAQNATDSAESIRDKVKEKLERAMNKPKAYIGTITDIADSTIQINNLEGEIQQIVIFPEDTSFVDVSDNKEIEYPDVAIGDKIVAVGFIDDNNILSALRIIITSSNEELERTIYNAEVVSIENRNITINDFEKGEIKLTFPRRWKGPEIFEFEEGQRVAAVSVNDEGTLTIRTIEIISNNESSQENE